MDKDSFANIQSLWIPEISAERRNIPIILCGTKTDLRGSASNHVSTAEGQAMARRIGADKFVECSAKDMYNVNVVIHEAVRAAVRGPSAKPISASTDKNSRESRKSCCAIL